MKRFSVGILIGFFLAMLFSAPWMYQAWAVGNCSVFRTWNTGDSVTAADLNSSFTTAAVTNSTPQCLDDYSATVSQMQSTADPYASSTESQATTMAGEVERLRFMFKQVFGLSQWYRHDQAPSFGSLSGHLVVGAIHVGSIAHIGQVTGNDTYAARFPTITGPDHWTGIFFPHATAHMAISIRDPNHATGGVQGGIELFRFHAAGLTFHHSTTLRFRHSETMMHDGQRGHVTALSMNPATDQLIVGHAGTTLQITGTGLAGLGGVHKVLFLSAAGHIYANSVSRLIGFETSTVHRVVLLQTDGTSAVQHASARINFTAADSALTAGNTVFMGPWATGATELVYVQQIIPFKATITNLYVKSNTAPGAAQTYTFTLMKNGVAQSLDAVMSGAGETTANNTSRAIDVEPGDYISLRATASAGAANNPTQVGSVAIVPRP